MGAGARVRVQRGDVFRRCLGRAPGCAEVCARAWVSVEHINLSARRSGRAPARVAVGAGARLPDGFGYVLNRR